MSKIPGLFKRGSTYWYRRRVPDDVVDVIGKKDIKNSLNTKDHAEAQRRARLAAVEWDARFEEARMSPSPTSPRPKLSRDDAIQLVRQYVIRMDAAMQTKGDDRSDLKAEEKRDIEIELAMDIQALQESGNPDRDRSVYKTAVDILQSDDRTFKDHSDDYSMFYEIVRRGLLEIHRRDQARLKDDFAHPFFDNLFAPTAAHGGPATSQSFGKLCDQYFANYCDEASYKKIGPRRVAQLKSRLVLIREIIGEDTPVHTIDFDICVSFRNTLAKVPKNRNLKRGKKNTPHLSLDDAIKDAAKEGNALFAYETQSAYLGHLTQVLTLAKKKKLITDVFSEGIPPNATKTPNKHKRDPFTANQIRDFFQSAYYKKCADGAGVPYSNTKEPWRYWLPLICAFMGMRPKEVCQMRLTDLETTTEGTPYLHVISTDDEEDENGAGGNTATSGAKTTKTETSRRKIPIHPELIRLGILEYHKGLTQAEGTMFLPGLKADKYGDRASYGLKRFRDTFLPKAITLTSKQTFYSFRHSFRDALRRIEAPPEVLQAIGGWSQGNLVSDDYGDGYGPDHLVRYIEKISYPGVDLSGLYATPIKG